LLKIKMTKQDLKKNINQKQKEVKNPSDFSLPKNWVETTLGEVVEIKYGKDHKKLEDGKIPCYGSGGFMRNVEKFLYDKPSVLIPRKGTISNLFFIEEPFWTVDTLFYTKINEDKILPKFLFYKLKNEKLESLNVGSAVPSLTTAVLNDFKINLPPLPQQKEIAEILSSFDDKIELLREQNQTLETLGQEIFKEWFGKYKVNGEQCGAREGALGYSVDKLEDLPDGWKVGKLGDIVDNIKVLLKKNDDLSNRTYIPIDEIPMKKFGLDSSKPIKEAISSLIAFEPNDILFGAMRCYFHRVNFSKIKGVTRSTVMVLRSRDDNLFEYALFLINQAKSVSYADQNSKGSTMPYAVWNNSFENMPIILPSKVQLDKFSELTPSFLNKIQKNINEIEILSKTRDTLLPKLMKGEVEVN